MWLVLNEYVAELAVTPGGEAWAKFDCVDSRLVEQRLLLADEPRKARAFSKLTNLLHVSVDADCWIEIVPSQYVGGIDLAAGEDRWLHVTPGAQLIAVISKKETSPCPIQI